MTFRYSWLVLLASLLFASFSVLPGSGGVHAAPLGMDDDDGALGTEEDRAALFEYLVEKTMERDAFASLPEHPLHREHPAGIDVIADMERYRDDLVGAETEVEMWHALWAISNARRDRHLRVYEIDEGIDVPDRLQQSLRAPIQFRPDYSDSDERFFFVGDLAADIDEHVSGDVPELGDRLLTINGRSVEDYADAMRPYHHASTENPYWWELADEITRTRDRVPHDKFYDDELETLTLGFERPDGTRYTAELPYLDPGEIEWEGHGEREYPGFAPVEELTGTYDTYRGVYRAEQGDTPALILDWAGFAGDLLEAMDHLMDYAEEQGILGHHVIVDATRSGGGSNGAYALARMQGEQFRTTAHNLKVSDLSEEWVRSRLESWAEDPPEPSRGQNSVYVKEWMETDAMGAFEEDMYYTNDVPFKGAQPKWADGTIEPADRHFTGGLTVWLSPEGGSHLDQFASQVVDNDIGHLMGMHTGGFSNSWWTSTTLEMPTTGEPIVEYEWSMGHSVRPNGEVLQYNPAEPHEQIPITRENYFEYHPMLLERTLERLDLDAPATE